MIQFTALSFNVALFVFGLIVGSFLNVVALRYRGKGRLFDFKKLSGRSHCRFCRHVLTIADLIPLVSFIWLKGRCRYCRRRIFWQYPVVELASGFVFLLPVYFHYSLIGAVWTLAALAMILLAAIDWRLKIIPDQISFFLGGLGIILGLLKADSFLNSYSDWLVLSGNPFGDRLLAGVFAALLFALIIIISRGRAMGLGDLKLAGALGFLLGWPDIIPALSFAFLLGAAVGIVFLLTKRKTLKSIIPFGPFLVAGVFVHILFGYQIANWYFTLMV